MADSADTVLPMEQFFLGIEGIRTAYAESGAEHVMSTLIAFESALRRSRDIVTDEMRGDRSLAMIAAAASKPMSLALRLEADAFVQTTSALLEALQDRGDVGETLDAALAPLVVRWASVAETTRIAACVLFAAAEASGIAPNGKPLAT